MLQMDFVIRLANLIPLAIGTGTQLVGKILEAMIPQDDFYFKLMSPSTLFNQFRYGLLESNIDLSKQ